MQIILAFFFGVLFFGWGVGAAIVSDLAGWDINKVGDLVKTIFWPISIFICKK